MVTLSVAKGHDAYTSTMTVEQTPGVTFSAPPAASAPPPPPNRARRAQSKAVQARQVQRVVTRLDPWSMLRVSLSFAFCLWMIIVVAGVLLWQGAVVTGSIGKVEDFLAQLLAESSFTIDGIKVFEGAAVAGFVLFVGGALFAVVTSVLFNLIAGAFGGLRFTVVELETAQAAPDQRS
jgi:hypothetical protein